MAEVAVPRSNYATAASRWKAIVNRDPNATCFVYAVKSTMIYCRARCPARLARRANIEFYDNAVEAERAGYRPCKRCKPEDLLPPEDPHIRLVRKACETLALAAEGNGEKKRPTLQDLAAEAGLTSSHFHRVFKKVTGMTPGKYAREIASQEEKQPTDYQRSNPSSIALTGASEPSPFTTDMSLSDHQGQIDEDLSFACLEAIDWSEFDMMLAMGTVLDPWPAGDGGLDTAWFEMDAAGTTAADIDPRGRAAGYPDISMDIPDIGSMTNSSAALLPTTTQCFGDESDLPIEGCTEGYLSSSWPLY